MAGSARVSVIFFSMAMLTAASIGDAVARDGDPDIDFGTLGSVILPFPGDLPIVEDFVDIQALPDGRILVSATVLNGETASRDFGVMRLNADGTLDTSFGDGGARVVGFDRPGSGNADNARSMAVQTDGRILIMGDAAGGIGGTDMAVVRLMADGSLDSSFGTGGKTTIAFDLGTSPERRMDLGVRIAVRPDGKIMLAGTATRAVGAQMAVARLTAGGLLDPSFDGDGKRTIDFGGGLPDISVVYRLLVAADGQRTYALGSASFAGDLDYAAARLLDNGSLDTLFAGDGTTTYGFDIASPFGDIATDAVELPDGRLLLCGISLVAATMNTDFSCMRLLANGTVDTDFPPVVIPFDLGKQKTDETLDLQVDAQGRVLLAGYAAVDDGIYDAALVRMLPSGQMDPTFGVDGRMAYDAEWKGEPGQFNRAHSVALQADGKIVLGGSTSVGPDFSSFHVHVIRIMGDGIFNDGFELPEL